MSSSVLQWTSRETRIAAWRLSTAMEPVNATVPALNHIHDFFLSSSLEHQHEVHIVPEEESEVQLTTRRLLYFLH
jgi:hypothetical protein